MKNKHTTIVLEGKLSSRYLDHEDKETSMFWKVFTVDGDDINLYNLMDDLEGDHVRITIEAVQGDENAT